MQLPIALIETAEAETTPEKIGQARKEIAEKSAWELDGPAHFAERKRMLASVAVEPLENAYERYIGGNDLLPINYLMIGHMQSRAVGCVRYFDLQVRDNAVATGFLISEDLLITNHHVFPVADAGQFKLLAKDAVVEFNHEFDIDGRRSQTVAFELEPNRFFHTNKELDLAVIAVKAVDQSGQHSLRQQGYLVLNGKLGKAGQGDAATIIQHPGGAEKQIAIRENQILDVSLPTAITYASDTQEGSSGAAVFNDEWQVIALHSAGVPKRNEAGQYLDKRGQVVEPVNGRIDGDRVAWVSNRGIRVSSIMKHLEETESLASHPLVRPLFSPAYTDSRPFAFLSRPTLELEGGKARSGAPATTAVPVTALPAVPGLNISINISSAGVDVRGGSSGVSSAAPLSAARPAAFTFEKKYEDELDYTDCDGFDEDFLGIHLPMPVPNAKLKKKLAYLLEQPSVYTLKYHHFSSIHHAVRRVPVVAASNVYRARRYPELDLDGARKDKWARDNRIDYDVQLNDAFYAKSGFDRGHLTRREDAEWGYTLDKARAAADMTCSYANAVPQVPALNRNRYGYAGDWGKLEEELLEGGIEKEKGKSGRMCVFAGPLFDEDDPVFKGVQVALDFYKVVCWYNAKGELRTTCYVLSQKDLVGEIGFEALRFDKLFVDEQVAIGDIEARTGLKFHENIAKADAFR